MRPDLRADVANVRASPAWAHVDYWGLLSLLGRLTLLATGQGSSAWLADMAKSFTWTNWTPSFPLVRERSLWLYAIGAHAAAEFGPDVLESYEAALNRHTHPAKALDNLTGVVAIGLRYAGACEAAIAVLRRSEHRLSERKLIGPEFFVMEFKQALTLLANGVRLPGRPAAGRPMGEPPCYDR